MLHGLYGVCRTFCMLLGISLCSNAPVTPSYRTKDYNNSFKRGKILSVIFELNKKKIYFCINVIRFPRLDNYILMYSRRATKRSFKIEK